MIITGELLFLFTQSSNFFPLVAAVIDGLKTLENCQFATNIDCGKASSAGEDLLFAMYKQVPPV